MSRAILGRENGFTLLEVVFAVGILAIGIMGYTSLKVSNGYSWVFAKNLSQAVPFSAGQLEGLLVAGFNSDLLYTDPDTKVGGIVYTATQYQLDYGDSLGIGDLAVGMTSASMTAEERGWAKGVISTTEGVFVDFAPTEVAWTVRSQCPTELTKMVVLTTKWGGKGSRNLSLNQVQVRP